jgi:hypothetical protein
MTKKQNIRSRTIYGTLTCPTDFSFSGSVSERQDIHQFFSTSSAAYLWSLLGIEKHQNGKYHYHYLCGYSTQVTQRLVDKHAEHFSSWTGSKCDRIRLVFKEDERGLQDLIGYITKEIEPDYTVNGKPPLKLNKIIENEKKKRELKRLAFSEGITPTKETLKDMETVRFVKHFMLSKGYYVNYHSRHIVGTDMRTFIKELNAEGFLELFGKSGVNFVKSMITDIFYTCLPMWEPDLEWVKFNDFWWNIETGSFYRLNYFEEEGLKEPIPVRIYDCNLPTTPPEHFLSSLERQNVNIENFRMIYGTQYKSKKRRDKCLLLYGNPFCGKSTLMLPFIDTFKDCIKEWVDDNGFSFSQIARHKYIYSDEINLFNNENNLNSMKQLLEGVEFNVKQKHKDSIPCVEKTGIFCSNDVPPQRGLNKHWDAILDRIDAISINQRMIDGDPIFMDMIKAESAQVLIWATQK